MSRPKSRHVLLSEVDRAFLCGITRTGSHPAQQVRRARILLELDENDTGRKGPVPTQEVVAVRAGVCTDTVLKVVKAYVERDGEVVDTVMRKKRLDPPVPAKATGEVEARLIALACSCPPEGHARWTLRLLEKQVLLTEGTPSLDHSTIGRVLKNETSASPEGILGDPTQGQWGVRRPHGGCLGGL